MHATTHNNQAMLINSRFVKIMLLFIILSEVHALETKNRKTKAWRIMVMGMVLTRTNRYVAEFGLNLGPSARHGPASIHALPGSRPGAPPTGHRAKTP